MLRILNFLFNVIRNEALLIRDRIRVAAIASRRNSVRIDPRAVLRVGSSCHLDIADGVWIGAFSIIILESDPRAPVDIKTSLVIGRGTYIGERNNIRGFGPMSIGEKCLISQGVSIIGANHSIDARHPIMDQPWKHDKFGVQIGNDVWVGANAVILPGVSIADGAVVAASSVVSKDVSPYSIVAGIPARTVGNRRD